jgi:hypothetical protein
MKQRDFGLRTVDGATECAEDWKRRIELRITQKTLSPRQTRENGENEAEILISSVFELTPTSSSLSIHSRSNPLVSSFAQSQEATISPAPDPTNDPESIDFPKYLNLALVVSGIAIGSSKVYCYVVRAWILSLLVGTTILVVS